MAPPTAGAGPSPRSCRASQGIVWGTNTALTAKDERLCNRFDYDGEYGTVLNRFLMQAASGIPLTVYGTGGQTRAFIHISDTCRCIELAVANPPAVGERVEILNQVAETAKVRDIAAMVAKLFDAEATPACSRRPPPPPPPRAGAGAGRQARVGLLRLLGAAPEIAPGGAHPSQAERRSHGSARHRLGARARRLCSRQFPPMYPRRRLLSTQVQQVENPRQEDAENDLVVANQKFKLLGLDPVLLESADGLFKEVTEITEKYLHRIDRSKVASIAYWNAKRKAEVEGGGGTDLGK